MNYLWNEKPIVRSETSFLNLKDDFVILAEEQDSPFHATLEKMICNCSIKGVKVFRLTHATILLSFWLVDFT